MQTVKKAVIPIGGIGSRFLPATKAVAKEMFPLVDKPVLLEILKECVDSGIEEVFIVLSPNKMNVKSFFEKDLALEQRLEKDGKLNYLKPYFDVVGKLKSLEFGVQKVARGSGDALFPAEKWVNGEPFAVLFGDDLNFTPDGMRPAIGQCIDAYELTHKLVIGCKPVPMEDISKYSSCIVGKEVSKGVFETSGIIEKPLAKDAPSNLAGLARYVVTPDIFDVLRRTPIDKRGELSLTDAMDIIAREKGATVCSFESQRYDTGDKLGYLKAQIAYALQDKDLTIAVENLIIDLSKDIIFKKFVDDRIKQNLETDEGINTEKE